MSDFPVWWRLCVAAAMVGYLVTPHGAWRGLAIVVLLVNGVTVIVRAALWLRRRLRLADLAEDIVETSRRRTRQ